MRHSSPASHSSHSIIIFAAAAFLLTGCAKPAAPTPAPVAVDPPKPIRWEYKVAVENFSMVQDAVAVAKNNLADAQHDLAVAQINQRLVGHWINEDAASSSNVDATVAFDLAKDRVESEREYGIRTNLAAVLNAQPDWELVSATLLPPSQGKVILIFKRPIP